MAAHAGKHQGWQVDVISRKQKSEISGAQFLHRSIPFLNERANNRPDATLKVFKRGDSRGYANKVYGYPTAPVSWDKFKEGDIPIWYLRAAYDRLWESWEDKIIDTSVTPNDMASILVSYDQVISTLPLQAICCDQNHVFARQQIWIGYVDHNGNHPNIMVYSGYAPDKWYRHSDIGGRASWEFAGDSPPDGVQVDNMVGGYKPLTNDCNCWTIASNFTKAGRYGRWERGILTHHAYEAARQVVSR
jgi:hypothetical protein